MSENISPTSVAGTDDPVRVRNFALFFKRYMSISTIVVAALPIPVTSFGLIPTYSARTKLLSIYTPLFCFLTLGLLFYLRHQFARIMFPEIYYRGENARRPQGRWFLGVGKFTRSSLVGLIPLLLIACSVIAAFQYNDVLALSTKELRTRWYQTPPGDDWRTSHIDRMARDEGADRNPMSFGNILRYTELDAIPYGSRLMVLYLAVFMMAEAAFILMALKEHLQDLIKVSDWELLGGDTEKPYLRP